MQIKYKLLLFFIFCTSILFSQSVKIDSMVTLVGTTKSDTIKINTLNEIAWQNINTGNYESALSFVNQAIDFSKEIMHSSTLSKQNRLVIKKNLGKSYNYLGIIYKYKGDYDKALEYYFKSLKIKEETEDKNGVAASYNNIGTIYTSKSYYDKALEFYFKSLNIFEELKDKNGMAATFNNIGNNHYLNKDYDKALEFYSKSLKIREETGDQKGMAKSYNNFGLIYNVRKEYNKSLEYYFKALEIRWAIKDKNGMASSHRNIGDVYILQNKLSDAKKHLLDALKIATEINAKPLMIDAYRSLSRCDSTQGDFKGAYKYYRLFSDTKDEVFNEESDKSLTEMQTKYESQKKEKEIALLNKEKEKQAGIAAAESKRQKQILLFVSGFLLLVITFSFFMYRGYRQKKKANDIISAQKIEVEKQRDLIEIKNKDITDSINYAKRIQTAILPSVENLQKHLANSFILYQPKDIVSGDFYWFTEKDNHFIVAIADCTGHGVPGAFMSMIGNDILTQIVIEKGITTPNQILSSLHDGVKKSLKQDTHESETKDGMDIAIVSFNKTNFSSVEYAGALRPLWLLKNNASEIYEYKADKHSIGGAYSDSTTEFTNHQISLNHGDSLYLSTDGYADQFGGEFGKKMMTKNMKDLLVSIQSKSMTEQKNILENHFKSWKQNKDQVDDVLVFGVRL